MDLRMDLIAVSNQDVQTEIAKNLCHQDRFHGFSGLLQPTNCDEMRPLIEIFNI